MLGLPSDSFPTWILSFFLYVRGGRVVGKSTAGDTMPVGLPDLLAVKVPRGNRYVRGGGEKKMG